MRRALWIAGIVIVIGLIAAVVCRFGCACCSREPDEAGDAEPEEEQEAPGPSEEPVEDSEEG